jgi:hypothetical protein
MTKRRMIHDCLWESEAFASLDYRARLLWIGLVTTADDQGRGRAHPGLLRAAVFPFDIITQDEIAADLKAIADRDMVLVYQVDDKAFYQVVNWWEYQTPQWVGPSDYPAPDGWDDRLRYHGKGHKVITQNWPGTEDAPPDDKADLPADTPGFERGKGKEEGKEEDSLSAFSDILTVWSELFPAKPQPTERNKALRSKTKTRVKDADFCEQWHAALVRASRSSFCRDGTWFTLNWFLANDENWRKCADGNYDDKRKPSNGGWEIPG